MHNKELRVQPAVEGIYPELIEIFIYSRRLLSLAATLCLLIGAAASSASAQASNLEFVPDQVVVQLSSTNDLPSVASEFKLDPTPLDQFGSRPIYRLHIIDGVSVPQRVSELQADTQSRVIFAEPNYLVKPPEGGGISWSGGGDTGQYAAQWATQKIGLASAHTVTRGAGITVAVLDTGIDSTHPALTGHLLPGYDFVDMDKDPSEEGDAAQGPYGHGTHVAGLVALVAPEAKIMPLRVLDEQGVGNIWVLAEALAYAVDPDGNFQTKDGADVINMSIATTRRTNLISTVLKKVIEEGDDASGGHYTISHLYNTVVIAASGNNGGNIPEYPAAEYFQALLAVAASDENDLITPFSTRGSWVGALAPGERILSTVPGGGYGTWRGTSMAAPITAGVAALVRSAFPTLYNGAVVSHLMATSKQISGPIPRRIDAAAAVTTEPQTPVPVPTVQFTSTNLATEYRMSEMGVQIRVWLSRTGDTLTEATVDYQTSDIAVTADCAAVTGFASSRCDYTPTSGTLRFAPGERFKSIGVPLLRDNYAEGYEKFNLTISNAQGFRLTDVDTATLIIGDSSAAQPLFEFTVPGFMAAENSATAQHSAMVRVKRTGDTSGSGTVQVITADDNANVPCDPAARDANGNLYPQGVARPRCDYATTITTLQFGPGEFVKDVAIPIINDAYVEPMEVLELVLFNPFGGNLGPQSTATLSITDNGDVPGASNPINSPEFFIRQHYVDFLGREPDPTGFAGWRSIIDNCAPGDTSCDRIQVSSGFFRSPEFQERGYFIYRFYASALGRKPEYSEFMRDIAKVNGFITDEQLEANRAAFAEEFITRQDFKQSYNSVTEPAAYVNALLATSGVNLPQQQTLIDDLLAGRKNRAEVLRAVVESPEVTQKFYNEAFVVMQYFGYLRRDPDILYLEWIKKMNQNQDYREMINGFINSPEYRQRFGL